jgi:putative tryptophan/tyrosine transport system substrate-binding protein
MNRRWLCIVVATLCCLLAAPFAAEAQQVGKMARVGILLFGVAPTLDEQEKRAAASPFWPAMKELGWVYGQNVVAERRYGESVDQLHTAAADLVRLKVDVIVAGTAGLAEIARLNTRAIPIVVAAAGADLVAAGLVGSLARPGGNVTGIQILSDELVGKRLELLKALVPNLSRVAWLRDDITWSAVPQVGARYDQQAAVAARTLGIALHPLVVHQVGELTPAFLSMMKNHDQGLVAVGSPFFDAHAKAIIELAAKHGIAAIYDYRRDVEAGGLMSYGVNSPELFRRLAFYVDKILRGANPADLPVEQPTKFDLVINLKTAKALGLTIPPSLLARADQVIQ